MRITVDNCNQGQWTDIISEFKDLSLMQTWEYPEAKIKTTWWAVVRMLFVEDGDVVGVAQALRRNLPFTNRGLIWINRGPLWRKNDKTEKSVLRDILQELHNFWVMERCSYLRIALPIDEKSFEPMLLGSQYRKLKDALGWASAAINLTLDKEDLRQNLDQKWRNCLSKAERLNMVCESGESDAIFDAIIEEYRSMLKAKRYTTSVTVPLLTHLQKLLPANRKLWGIVAKQENQFLGGILLARYGTRAEYLVGAINDNGRSLNAGQLLLWRAICEMQDAGCLEFDLGGMDPILTPQGIFHFKKGLGGTSYRFANEIESVANDPMTTLIRWGVRLARRA